MAEQSARIQGIEFKIQGDVSNAKRAIDDLKKTLNELKRVVGGGLGLAAAANEIKSFAGAMKDLKEAGNVKISKSLSDNLSALSGAMKAIKSEQISALRQMASAIKTFKDVGDIRISATLPKSIADLAVALDIMEQKHIDRLAKVAQALQLLRGAKTSIGNALPTQLKDIAAAVDSITDATIAKIHRLTLALSRLKGVDLSGLAAVLQAQNAAGRNRNGGQNPGNAGNAGPQNNGQHGAGGQSGKIGFRGSSSLQDIAKQLLGNILPAVKSFIGFLGTAAKFVAQIAAGIAKWAFRTAINAVKRLISGIKTFAKNVANVGKNLFKHWYDNSVFKKLEDSFKRIQRIISSFGRVAFYRAVRSAIKYVTDALKEGTENAYWFSKNFGDATQYISEAYDRLSSSNFKMSNQLGAAWATLIATIEPILIRVIELVTKAADAITQFFAALGGKSIYMKAVDYNKAWADSADEAAESAKEWKNQILGFDEINRLEEPSDGGSGKKKKDYTDYENMFEEVPIDSWFAKLKEMLQSGEWDQIGEMLGNKFNDLVNNFDWARWGKKIGEGIQKGIDLAYRFLKTADFRNLGSKIMEFINSAADAVDFQKLGRLATRLKTAIWDILYGAFTTPGSLSRLATNLSDFIIGALDELAEWLSSLEPDKIAASIREFFDNIKGDEIKSSFVTVIKTAWEKAIALKEELFPDGLVATARDGIVEFIGKIPWSDVKDAVITGFETVRDTLGDIVEIIWPEDERDAFKDKLADWLQVKIEAAVNKIKDAVLNAGKNLGKALIDGIKEFIFGKGTVLEQFMHSQRFGPVAIAERGVRQIGGFFKGMLDNGKMTSAELDGITERVQQNAETLYGDMNTTMAEITGNAVTMHGDVTTEFDLMKAEVSAKNSELLTDTQNMMGDVHRTWAGAQSDVSTVTADVQAQGDQTVQSITEAASEISSTFSEISGEYTQNEEEAGRWKGAIQTDLTDTTTSFKDFQSNVKSELGKVNVAGKSTSTSFASGMRNMSSSAASAANSISSSMSRIAAACRNAISALNSVAKAQVKAGGSFGVSWYGGGGSLRAYASGGFPEDGLFMANHGELVGQFSNGKTAVANNEQITEGIAAAVYGAFVRAFSETGGNSGTQQGDIVLKVNDREFARATYPAFQAVAREKGISMINGREAVA